jgi:hypothetical protein
VILQSYTVNGQDMLRLLEHYRVLLESLFPSGWFEQPPRKAHPAYERWTILNQFLASDGTLNYPLDRDLVSRLGRVLLDSFVVSTLGIGNLPERRPGDLAKYGGAEMVQKFIKRRVIDREDFEDVLVELAFGVWHIAEGHSVMPSQEESEPDLFIKIPAVDLPIAADCKKIWTPNPKRPAKSIQSANAQVGRHSASHYGIAVLDVSEVVGASVSDTDEYPLVLQELLERIQAAVRGPKNRSVAAVVVLWDDVIIQDGLPKSVIRFRRRHHVVAHSQATRPIPDGLALFRGFEAIHTVLWDLPRQGPWPFEVTEVFAEVSEAKLGISRQTAVDAVVGRTDVTTLYLDPADSSHRVSIYAKVSKVPDGSAATLVCAEDGQHPTRLHWALSLAASQFPRDSIPSPLKLLQELVEQAGEPLSLEGSPKFLLEGEIPTPEWESMIARGRRRQDGYLAVYLGMRIGSVDQPRVRVLLAFCLDLRKLTPSTGPRGK